MGRRLLVAFVVLVIATIFSSSWASTISAAERIAQRRLAMAKNAATKQGFKSATKEAASEYVKKEFTDYLKNKRSSKPFANTTDLFTVIPGRCSFLFCCNSC
jgi:hypothetical protein